MSDSPVISIIAPVYNVSQYLSQFISSILSQSFSNFELILIDDGSTDNSLKICKTYAEEDSRIILFHQTNAGVSAARNKGLELSQGKYISFIDPDDVVERNFLEAIYNDVESNANVQMVECYTKQFGDNGKIFTYKKFYKNSCIVPGQRWQSNAEYYFTRNKNLPRTVLFSADIIKNNNIFFNESYSVCEDCDFVFRYVHHIKNVFIDSNKYYCYRQRLDSLTNAKGISASQFSAILFYKTFSKSVDKKIASSFALGEAKVYMRFIIQEFKLSKKSKHYKQELAERLTKVKFEFLQVFSNEEYEVFLNNPFLFIKKQLKQACNKLDLSFSSMKWRFVALFIRILSCKMIGAVQ